MEKQDSFANIYGVDPIDYLEVNVECADFSVRTLGRLRGNGINTVADLLRKNEVDFLSIKGFGRNSYNEVLQYIKSLHQRVQDSPILKWFVDSRIGLVNKRNYFLKENLMSWGRIVLKKIVST